ncbi:hypothetical protein ACFWC9_31725 [Streptomyces goshikiensis]|uniref:hypothetical protein n=1 Tax=Streptomyces goshikiensis TaxID=1942 RepID=UPI003689B179
MANHLTQIAARLADVERRLTGLTRTTSLAYSSVEAGAIEVYDEEGVLTGIVGVQVDGTTGVATVNGPPPPTPTAPQVVPVLGGLRIGWDGAFTDAAAAPLNLGRVQVHLLLAADQQIDVRNPAATIEAASGATVTIAVSDYVPRHVRLVALSTAGIPGPVSAAVVAAARQAVGQDLLDGIVSEVKLAEKAVTDTKIAVGAVGTAALADGSILADKLAKASVTGDKIGAGAVTLNALGGALADGITQHYVDALGDPAAWTQVAIGAGAKWEHLAGVQDAPTGRTVGQAAGYVAVRGTTLIPYDPDTLYRVSARIRTVRPSDSGTDDMYVGVLGFGADGKTIVNRVGVNSVNSQYYCAASRTSLPAGAGWQVFTGYLRGRAATGATGTAGVCADPRAPGKVHDQVRFVVPYLYLNYESAPTGAASATGVMHVDAVTVEVLKTGIVDSSNLVAGSVTTGALATDSVTAGKVAADTITGRELQASSVSAGHVVAGAITTDKLAALTVTADKIAASSITADKVAALSITAEKLAANSVRASAIAAGAIEAIHIKTGSISADKIALGLDGNMVADSSFEGEVALKRVEVPSWSIVTPGRDTAKALRVDCTAATATDRFHTLGVFAATPGTRVWMAADYQVSADWVGKRAQVYIRWEDAQGGTLGYSRVVSTAGAPGKGWLFMSGSAPEPAPAQTATGRMRLAVDAATAGTVTFDNVVIRTVVSSGTPGGRAEISPEGVRLFDADGEESISLVTGKPQYLTITNDGTPVATINEYGHASFNDLSVAGQLTIKGERLETQLVDLARGVVAIHSTAQAVEAAMGTETGYIELPVRIEADRQYRIVVNAYLDSSAASGEYILVLRDGGTGAPIVTSRQIQSIVVPTGGGWQRVRLEHTCSGSSLGAGTHRLLSTFLWRQGAAGGTVSMFGGAEFPAVMYVEDVGKAIASTGELNRGAASGGGTDPSKPATQRYEKTYGASWSGTYTNRSGYSSYHGNQMLQGYYSSTNGVTASLVGFPSALTSDLAGAKIEKVMLFLYFEHWYFAAGGSAVLKTHGLTSRPGSFSSDGASMTVSWRRNEGKWVDVTGLFDASKKGIALDPNSTSSTYYGRAHGVGQQYPPQLKVTYVK